MELQPLYIVQRIEWTYSDMWFYQEGETPLKAFADRDAAERFRQEKENEARAELLGIPPDDDLCRRWSANLGQTFGDLEILTSLTEAAFREKIQEINLPPLPPLPTLNFACIGMAETQWWRDAWAALAPDRTALLWNLLDRLHFFEIIEVETPPVISSAPAAPADPVREEFRLDYPYRREEPTPPYEFMTLAFHDRKAAERWVEEHATTQRNPFQDTSYEADDLLKIYLIDGDTEFDGATERVLFLTELQNIVQSLGFPPPREESEPGALWREWWDENAVRMTARQKTALWRFVAPFPYDRIAVETENDEMAKALIHARSSVRRWGGKAEDYLAIHEKMDSTKAAHAEVTHRCVFHSAFGIFLVEEIFGRTLTNADGREIHVRDIAEQHVLEDLGCIPSLSDWLKEMPSKPWMAGARKLRIEDVEIIPAPVKLSLD